MARMPITRPGPTRVVAALSVGRGGHEHGLLGVSGIRVLHILLRIVVVGDVHRTIGHLGECVSLGFGARLGRRPGRRVLGWVRVRCAWRWVGHLHRNRLAGVELGLGVVSIDRVVALRIHVRHGLASGVVVLRVRVRVLRLGRVGVEQHGGIIRGWYVHAVLRSW